MIYQRIVYFLQAAENDSFSKAAEKAYVSSQALTKQIHQLEEELGAPLFQKGARGIKLTPFGQTAYESLKRINDDFDSAIRQLKQQAGNTKPTCNIGIFSALPREQMVTPIISFLLSRFHNYRLNINLVELNEGKQMINNGELNLLLTNFHDEDDFLGNRRYFMEKQKTKVVVSLYHPWALKEKITVEDMKQETFLKMDMNSDAYLLPTKDCFYENIPCKRIEIARNFSTILALLKQGNCFAVFPKAFAYMEQEKMKYFDVPDRDLYFYSGIIYNSDLAKGTFDSIVEELTDEFSMKELKL